MPLTRVLLWIMIVSLVATAMLGVLAIILPTGWRTQSQVLGTCLLIALFSLPAFGCGTVLQKRRLVPVMRLALFTLLLALGTWLLLVWGNFQWQTDQKIAKAAGTLTIVGLWATHLGILVLLRLATPAGSIVRAATLTVAALAAIMGISGILLEPPDDIFFRALLVLLILTACGTLVVPLLAVIDLVRGRTDHESMPSRVRIAMTCPRCGTDQNLPVGPARCTQCNLRIVIDIEEPRCSCGYLLYRLEGANCPECGRFVCESNRWTGGAVNTDAS